MTNSIFDTLRQTEKQRNCSLPCDSIPKSEIASYCSAFVVSVS